MPLSEEAPPDHIGLQRDGVPDNFVEIRPQRRKMGIDFRITRTDELDARIDGWGLTLLRYDKGFRRYCFSVTPTDLDTYRTELLELTRLARGLPAVEDDATTELARPTGVVAEPPPP